jgi:hypothetical protein
VQKWLILRNNLLDYRYLGEYYPALLLYLPSSISAVPLYLTPNTIIRIRREYLAEQKETTDKQASKAMISFFNHCRFYIEMFGSNSLRENLNWQIWYFLISQNSVSPFKIIINFDPNALYSSIKPSIS